MIHTSRYHVRFVPLMLLSTIVLGAAFIIGLREAAAADVTCEGLPATIIGTNQADVLTGTPGPDVIVSFNGDDTITSLGGADVICAGNGADVIDSGPGADIVLGERGADQIDSGTGADIVLGGHGADQISAGAGSDILLGNRGDDVLDGGPGFDVAYGGSGHDVCLSTEIHLGCESTPSGDATPPTGSITIGDGSGVTRSAGVSIMLAASDDVGVTEYRMANGSDLSGATWAPYVAEVAWSLPDGDGLKTVSAQFRDAAGNESDVATATIVLDTTAPSVAVEGVGDGDMVDLTTQLVFELGGTAEDATDIVSVIVSAGGQSATADFAPSGDGVAWWLDVSAPASGTYTYEVTVRDTAGNEAVTSVTLDVLLPAADEIVVKADVVVLDADQRAGVLAYDAATGRLEMASAAAAGLAVGDVIVSERAAALPGGLLRRIAGIADDGVSAVVTTTTATLVDVFWQAGIALSDEVPAAQRIARSGLAARALQPADAPAALAPGEGVSFTVPLDVSVELGVEDGGTLAGTFAVDSDVTFTVTMDLDVELTTDFFADPLSALEAFRVEASGEITGQTLVEVSATAGVELIDKDITLFQRPVFFAVGFVPVEATLEVDAEVEWEVEAGVAGRWTDDFTAVLTGSVEKIGDTFVSSGSATDDHEIDVALGGEVTSRAQIGLEAEVLLYDTVGPKLFVGPAADFDALIDFGTGDIDWTLEAGLIGELGIEGEVPVLGLELFDLSVRFLELTKEYSGTVSPIGEPPGGFNADLRVEGRYVSEPLWSYPEEPESEDSLIVNVFMADTPVTYEFTVTNLGPDLVTDADLIIQFDSVFLEFRPHRVEAAPVKALQGVIATPAGCSPYAESPDEMLACNLGFLGVGESETFTLTVTHSHESVSAITRDHPALAWIDAALADPNPEDNGIDLGLGIAAPPLEGFLEDQNLCGLISGFPPSLYLAGDDQPFGEVDWYVLVRNCADTDLVDVGTAIVRNDAITRQPEYYYWLADLEAGGLYWVESDLFLPLPGFRVGYAGATYVIDAECVDQFGPFESSCLLGPFNL